MKTKSLLRLWLLAIMLYSSIGVAAHDFEVGGIYYKITSRTDYTVAVSYRGNCFTLSYSNVYAGSVVIPENVTYNGNVYRVTSIGSSAF